MCDSMVTYNELYVQPFQCLDTNMASVTSCENTCVFLAQQAQLYLVLRWYNESLIFNSQAIFFLDEDAEKGKKNYKIGKIWPRWWNATVKGGLIRAIPSAYLDFY